MKINTSYQRLRWDSALFGYPVARLYPGLREPKLAKALDELKHQNVKLVYWFVDSSNRNGNDIAIRNKGILVDKKITYVMDNLNINSMQHNPNVFVYAKAYVSANLKKLALESGRYSRFSKDKNFVHHEYETLYTTWIINSVLHKIAFAVLVFGSSYNDVKGFISLEAKGNTGTIGLLAVDKQFRRQSIGRTLIVEALMRFRKRGCTRVTVTTQNANTVACRFYESIGFSRLKMEHVYHFWL